MDGTYNSKGQIALNEESIKCANICEISNAVSTLHNRHESLST